MKNGYIVTLEKSDGSHVEFFYEKDHQMTLTEAQDTIKRLEGFHPENKGFYNIFSLHKINTSSEEEEGDEFEYDDDDLDEIFNQR